MNRGEIWTVSGSGEYTNKPRPCLILQGGDLSFSDSVIGAVLTSDSTMTSPYWYWLYPDKTNGLKSPSLVMIDKLISIKIQNYGKLVGVIDQNSLNEIERIVLFILGFNFENINSHLLSAINSNS